MKDGDGFGDRFGPAILGIALALLATAAVVAFGLIAAWLLAWLVAPQ